MKNKKVIISIIGLLLVSSLLVILATKNNKKYIMQDGIMLALSLDGKSITSFPERNKYRVKVDCDNAIGQWNSEDWNITIDNITGNVVCNLDFYTINDKNKLKNIVESLTSENYGASYDKATTMTESEYGTPSMFSSTSYSSTSGTTTTNSFSFSGTQWSSIPGNLTSGTYYHLKISAPEEAYYQLCYTVSSGHSSNYLYIYKNSTQLNNISASSSSSKSNCIEVGRLTTSDYVKITQRAYSSSSYPVATISFYLQKTNDTESSGYRYNGRYPNNYVWFNNELWRIIGSIPTCTSSGCSTSENLVKIIRDQSIGGIAYDASESNSAWGSNTLFSLLNNYYYGKKDGTNSGYCYGSASDSSITCDYTGKGIEPSGFYGQMLKQVYWNTGLSYNSASSNQAFINETATQTVSGYVGLMSSSDYGFAASSNYYTTILSKYNSSSIVKTNWLYGAGMSWTNIQSSSSGVLYVYYPSVFGSSDGSGGLSNGALGNGAIVRPVVYLNPDVYVVSGDGSITNPYQIAM